MLHETQTFGAAVRIDPEKVYTDKHNKLCYLDNNFVKASRRITKVRRQITFGMKQHWLDNLSMNGRRNISKKQVIYKSRSTIFY